MDYPMLLRLHLWMTITIYIECIFTIHNEQYTTVCMIQYNIHEHCIKRSDCNNTDFPMQNKVSEVSKFHQHCQLTEVLQQRWYVYKFVYILHTSIILYTYHNNIRQQELYFTFVMFKNMIFSMGRTGVKQLVYT